MFQAIAPVQDPAQLLIDDTISYIRWKCAVRDYANGTSPCADPVSERLVLTLSRGVAWL